MPAAGEAEGVGRAKVAVDDALDNPLLESAAIAEARGCLVNVSGGADLTLFEVCVLLNTVACGAVLASGPLIVVRLQHYGGSG